MTVSAPLRRIAVAGATGRIGALTVAALRDGGHDVVEISRSHGVNLESGTGLGGLLDGVEAVVDCTNTATRERDAAVEFFTSVTAHLLAAEERAGVGHHVALSIVGLIDPPTNPHYAGKLAQEATVAAAPVPWTVVRATQFHDFAEMVVGWTEADGAATIAPLLVRPVAPRDVATVLAEVALGPPQLRHLDVAGPDPQDLVDMARRTLAARGRRVRLVPTWEGPFGTAMAGNVLLPGPDARILPTSFEEWLEGDGAERHRSGPSDQAGTPG